MSEMNTLDSIPINVLLAEDDPLVLETLQELVESFGMRCTTAADGHEALACFDVAEPDVVLSDIRMPGMDGYQLLQEIQLRAPWVPVIFLSAKAAKQDIRAGMELGADDYLTKPFDAVEVRAALESRARRGRQMKQQIQGRSKFLQRYLPHELRTPLVGVLGFGEMLLMDAESGEQPDPEVVREYAQGVVNGGRRLLDLVENFALWAELSRSESSVKRHLIRPSDTAYLTELEKRLSELAERYARIDDLNVALEPVKLPWNTAVLVRVVGNLVENAFKFSLPGSPVKLRGLVNAGAYEFRVSNAKSEHRINLQKVDFFVQPGRERHEQQGMGLGLALTRLFADQIEGRLFNEDVGGQVEIVLSLPLRRSETA